MNRITFKFIVFITTIVVFANHICAQSKVQEPLIDYGQIFVDDSVNTDTTLKHYVQFDLSQNQFENWQGGGKNTVIITMDYLYSKEMVDSLSLKKYFFKLRYGFQKVEKNPFSKLNDQLEYQIQYGYKYMENMFYSAELNFQTQISSGYDEKDKFKSSLFAPAYLSAGAGGIYRKDNTVLVYFSPITYKLTTLLNKELSDQGLYGLEEGDYLKHEFGLLSNFALNFTPLKNSTLDIQARFYSNYLINFGVFDVNFLTDFKYFVTSNFNFNFKVDIRYDEDVKFYLKDTNEDGEINNKDQGKSLVQWLQVISIGFNYQI